MLTLTVVLDADDTPKSIATLVALATARPQITDAAAANPTSKGAKSMRHALWLKIRGEAGNNVDVTNGAARVGFETTNVAANFTVSRVVATSHGIPLTPGTVYDFPSSGAAAIYDFTTISISGKTGDIFQIEAGVL